jgi:cytochrome c biogenesis protein CcmG, thiol:disulfide interchange protein DsbE
MAFKHLPAALAAAALLGVLAVGLIQLSANDHSSGGPIAVFTPAQAQIRLAGSPAPLAALHAQGDALLEGGATALHARLTSLRGWPVVVNKWASWCGPCKSERAVFQHASVELGRRVAFVGIDSGDHSRSDALSFLRSLPLSYPSYYDPSEHLGTAITGSPFMPVTVFYNRRGALQFIHQGAFQDLRLLERDIRLYALDA